ncbi:MAG: hypothetical protein EA413_02995, partial [Cyanobium sp. PLM2.Bin73]
MPSPLFAAVTSGFAALALSACVIVNAPPTSPDGTAQLEPWRRPQAKPAGFEASASGGNCDGEVKSAQQIFSQTQEGVAVVLTADGQGSAFVVSHTGGTTLLLTNSHVVGSHRQVELVWSDGQRDR